MTRRRLLIALVVVVALLAAAAGVWFATRPSDESKTFEPVSEYSLDLFGIRFDNGVYGVSFTPVQFALLVAIIVVAAVWARHACRQRRKSSPPTEPRG